MMNRLFASMILIFAVSISAAQEATRPLTESRLSNENLVDKSNEQTNSLKKKDSEGVIVQLLDEGPIVLKGKKENVKALTELFKRHGENDSVDTAAPSLPRTQSQQLDLPRLTELRSERQRLANDFGPSHPTVRQLDREIEILEEMTSENVRTQNPSGSKIAVFYLKHTSVAFAAEVLEELEITGVESVVPVALNNSIIVKADDQGRKQIEELFRSFDVPAEKEHTANRVMYAAVKSAGSTDLDLDSQRPEIAPQKVQYDRGERKAAELATRLRTAKATNNSHQVETLTAQLRQQVKSVFELRMQIQQAELDEAEASLSASRDRLAGRQRIADAIITRRVEELVSGQDMSWMSGVDGANASVPEQILPNKQPEQTDYNSYQGYLRDEIGALQQHRRERLTGIVSIEQELVAIQSELIQPAVDDQTRLKSAAEVLSAQRVALRREVATAEAQIAQLEMRLLEDRQGDTGLVAVHGEVGDVDGRNVNLSVGRDGGVDRGMKLKVFREDLFIDEIEIVEVQPDSCVGIAPSKQAAEKMKPGDTAILLLDPRLHDFVGVSPGESLYNEEIKRFKFRLRSGVKDFAATGQRFMRRYLSDKENPPIYGMWGDPSTSSIVVIAPAASESAIREFLIKGEVIANTGFDVGN